MAHEVPIAWSFTEIKQVFGEVTGKGLWVKARFYDWILTETKLHIRHQSHTRSSPG